MFSIVIPTWNNLDYLKLLVDSLERHSAYKHQILIHVNDGSDGTLEWVRQNHLSHTASPENIGICFAVNRAAALANQPYLVYMNDDMVVLPDWDRELVNYIHQFEGAGEGADTKASETQPQRFMLSATMVEPRATGNRCVVVADWGRTAQTYDEAKALAQAPGSRRGNWLGSTWPPTLVPTWMWHEVGGYSTEFSPGMSSDNDFAMKVYHAGCRIFLGVGSSLVYHFACVSTGRVKKNDGRKQFLRKWSVTQRDFDRHVLQRGENAPVAGTTVRASDVDLKRFRWKAEMLIRFRK
jgi:glycosyltransferase involved in cell wall biosynthesis